MDTITFTFFGSTVLAGPGTFDVDLGHFTTLDGEVVKSVSHVSGELAVGDFSNVTFMVPMPSSPAAQVLTTMLLGEQALSSV